MSCLDDTDNLSDYLPLVFELTLLCVAYGIAQSAERPHAQKMATSIDNPNSKKRCTGIDPAWSDDFPWMLPIDVGLYDLFIVPKYSRRLRKSVIRRAVWTDAPCQLITRQALVKHSQSESHVEAVKMEATLCSSRGDSGIRMVFERVALAERKERFHIQPILFLSVSLASPSVPCT